jgi:transcriptional regulator with XRE-family HTH domain
MKAKMDWSQVVTFILDELFFSQKELADKCNVTQQSISNWKQKVRSPGPYPKRRLCEILGNGGARASSFKGGNDPNVKKTPDLALQELIDTYNELPLQSREFLVELARFECTKNIHTPDTE